MSADHLNAGVAHAGIAADGHAGFRVDHHAGIIHGHFLVHKQVEGQALLHLFAVNVLIGDDDLARDVAAHGGDDGEVRAHGAACRNRAAEIRFLHGEAFAFHIHHAVVDGGFAHVVKRKVKRAALADPWVVIDGRLIHLEADALEDRDGDGLRGRVGGDVGCAFIGEVELERICLCLGIRCALHGDRFRVRFALADLCDIERIGAVVRRHQFADLRRVAQADLDVLHGLFGRGVAQGERHVKGFACVNLFCADGVGIEDHLRLGDGLCAVRAGAFLIALDDVHIDADRHALARVGGVPILKPGDREIHLLYAGGDFLAELEAAVTEFDDRAAVQVAGEALGVIKGGDLKREGIEARGEHRRDGHVGDVAAQALQREAYHNALARIAGRCGNELAGFIVGGEAERRVYGLRGVAAVVVIVGVYAKVHGNVLIFRELAANGACKAEHQRPRDSPAVLAVVRVGEQKLP